MRPSLSVAARAGWIALCTLAASHYTLSSTLAQPAPSGIHTITIIVGTPAGGGYDVDARLVARHLGSMIAGVQNIVVQDMPGAGSLIAANWLANSAPNDGSTIAILPSGTMFEAMLGNKSAHFDVGKFNMIGSLDRSDPVALVWAQTPFKTARDLFDKQIIVGASGASSNNSVLPNLLNALIDTKFKIVNGYPGESGLNLALQRGEVQAEVGPDWNFVKAVQPDWIRDHKIRVLMQATLTRSPDLPDVPTATQFVNDQNRDALKLLLARQTFSGVFLAPPGVPSSMVAMLRAGFSKMVADPDFKQDAQQSGLSLNPTAGDGIDESVKAVLASPQPVIAQATAVLRRFEP
jgi:tripartite-type tricarboxylate transporter receptor subunit TctC